MEAFNEVCHAAAKIPDRDLDKFTAAVLYANTDTSCEVCRIAESMELFEYAPGVRDTNNLGAWWLENKESCAAEMAKTAVAFCVLRSRQIGKPITVEALADQMAKLYKPHRDKQNVSSQLDSIGYDLKEIREDADKSDAQTKTEIEWQIRRMLLLGLSCLQLGGSISLSPTVAEPTVGQAISY